MIRFTRGVKAQWVAALRNGEYTQGSVTLCNRVNNTYCCLGVLADLHNQLDSGGNLLACPDAGYLILPGMETVVEGLSPAAQIRLGDLNDAGADFVSIADYIEENVPAIVDEVEA